MRGFHENSKVARVSKLRKGNTAYLKLLASFSPVARHDLECPCISRRTSAQLVHGDFLIIHETGTSMAGTITTRRRPVERATITKRRVDALRPGDSLVDDQVRGFLARCLMTGSVS